LTEISNKNFVKLLRLIWKSIVIVIINGNENLVK